MNAPRIASSFSVLAVAALAACGDDSGMSSGDAGETGLPSGGDATTTNVAPATSSADTSSGEGSESGPAEVPPGSVISSETFYVIGASATISDLAPSPSGAVHLVLDAYFPRSQGWQLQRLGGERWPSPRVAALAFEPDGSILCAGRLSGSDDFGGGRVTSVGDSDVAIVKRAPDGTHVYTRVFGEADTQYGVDASVDAGGNVVIGGAFRGSIDFGSGAFASEDYDRFLLRLDPQGNVVDALHLEDTNNDTVLYVAGTADGYVMATRAGDGLDVAGTILSSVESGTGDLVVASFDLAGALVWTYVLAVPGSDGLDGLAIAPGGEILILGNSQSEVDLGAGSTAPAGEFLARLGAGGAPLGAVAVDATLDAGLAVDATGAIALVGTFGSYVAERWDADGTPVWRTDVGGASGDLVTFDGDGNVVVAGQRQNTDEDFDVVVTTLAR